MIPVVFRSDGGRSHQSAPLRLLVLGGTTEATALAHALAGRADTAPIISLAGRTEQPAPLPVPCRVGSFGGIAGLAAFLRDKGIDAVVDATHPFAARISANAVVACRDAGVPLAVFTRPPWQAQTDDLWTAVPDIAAAVATLRDLGAPPYPVILSRPPGGRVEGRIAVVPGGDPADPDAVRPSTRSLRDRLRMKGCEGRRLRVFLTTGRLDLACFKAAPDHDYLVRTIDQPAAAELPLRAHVIRARPPFGVDDEVELMRTHCIDLLVTKNSGGAASAAKLHAARCLSLPVLMIERPTAAGPAECYSLDAILAWIAFHADTRTTVSG